MFVNFYSKGDNRFQRWIWKFPSSLLILIYQAILQILFDIIIKHIYSIILPRQLKLCSHEMEDFRLFVTHQESWSPNYNNHINSIFWSPPSRLCMIENGKFRPSEIYQQSWSPHGSLCPIDRNYTCYVLKGNLNFPDRYFWLNTSK